MGREGGMAFSCFAGVMDDVGVGLRIDGSMAIEDEESAAPAERGVFRAARTRDSSRLGSFRSSSLSDGEGGGDGDPDRGKFFALRRSLAALGFAIATVLLGAAMISRDRDLQ